MNKERKRRNKYKKSVRLWLGILDLKKVKEIFLSLPTKKERKGGDNEVR